VGIRGGTVGPAGGRWGRDAENRHGPSLTLISCLADRFHAHGDGAINATDRPSQDDHQTAFTKHQTPLESEAEKYFVPIVGLEDKDCLNMYTFWNREIQCRYNGSSRIPPTPPAKDTFEQKMESWKGAGRVRYRSGDHGPTQELAINPDVRSSTMLRDQLGTYDL
jgi:hypothetical protein